VVTGLEDDLVLDVRPAPQPALAET
jgi:hypothetical protein